jgi:hypothetical protein
MDQKRLFKVTVVYFVAANDLLGAAGVPPKMGDADVTAEEVKRLEDVPKDWQLAYPMGHSGQLCRDFFRR